MAIVRKLFAYHYHFVSNIAIVCGIIGFGNGTITGYPSCQTWKNDQLTSNAFFWCALLKDKPVYVGGHDGSVLETAQGPSSHLGSLVAWNLYVVKRYNKPTIPFFVFIWVIFQHPSHRGTAHDVSWTQPLFDHRRPR